jgi:hypothetical protein
MPHKAGRESNDKKIEYELFLALTGQGRKIETKKSPESISLG